MTSITRHLPWPIKDLGVAIIGEGCYHSLVENLNVSDVACLRYSLSKALGIGIVVGGSVMKVPQVLLIVNARSARGISLTAYILETLSYAITLTYSVRNTFPFSTYGENLFLTIQNVLVCFLIVNYSSPNASLLPLALGTIASSAALYVVPAQALSFLQLSTLPLSLFSKLPQIRQNHRAQSTGQLSAVAVLAQVLGCLARLFTTATEVGDTLVSAGFALALALNLVLGVQMWMYWNHSDPAGFGTQSGGNENKGRQEERKVSSYVDATPTQVKAEPVSPAPVPAWQQRVATPPPAPASPSGRKWARKLD